MAQRRDCGLTYTMNLCSRSHETLLRNSLTLKGTIGFRTVGLASGAQQCSGQTHLERCFSSLYKVPVSFRPILVELNADCMN